MISVGEDRRCRSRGARAGGGSGRRRCGRRAGTVVRLAGALALACGAALPATTFDALRRDLAEAVDHGRVPSIAVAVARGGEVVWEAAVGWADREREIAATPHTPYALASVSKPFTATLLVLLAERGEVDLDAPVGRYLPAPGLASPPGRDWRPTVRQVADHTAGLPPYHRFFVPGRGEEGGAAGAIRRSGFLAHPPGTRFEYSNLGYAVLERVIGRAAGKPYPEVLAAELLRPLGLEHTAVTASASSPGGAAVRYAAAGERLPDYRSDHGGGSAVVACVRDLVRFGSFHLGRVRPGGTELLARRALLDMRRPSARRPRLDGSYALGWTVHRGPGGATVARHAGGMPGAGASLVLVPSRGLVVAVLANARSELVQRTAAAALAAASPRWPDPADWLSPAVARPRCDGSPPRRLRGAWEGSVEVEEAREALHLLLAAEGSTLRLAGEAKRSITSARFCDRRRLEAWTAGPLPGAPEGEGPGRLRICLERDGDELLGAATAYFHTGEGLPAALSYPLRLARGAADRGPTMTARSTR